MISDGLGHWDTWCLLLSQIILQDSVPPGTVGHLGRVVIVSASHSG